VFFLLYRDQHFYFTSFLHVGAFLNIVALENYELNDLTTESWLHNFNFSLAPGEACSISADYPDNAHLLASALATLIRPDSGKYIFMDTTLDFSNYRNLLEYKKQLGYFGPDTALLSNLTVRENLLLSRAYFENALDLDLDDNVKDLCDAFHLTDKLDLRPAALRPMDIRAAIMIREFSKTLKLLIIDSPEDLISHPGFNFLVKKAENMIASGIPLVLLCENDEVVARLTDRAVRIPSSGHQM
jgi:ABC-type lipoprotein export system ATPase subunit